MREENFRENLWAQVTIAVLLVIIALLVAVIQFKSTRSTQRSSSMSSMPIVGAELASSESDEPIIVTVCDGDTLWNIFVLGRYAECEEFRYFTVFEHAVDILTITEGLDPLTGLDLDKIKPGQKLALPSHCYLNDNWIRGAIFADPPLPRDPRPEKILLAQAK